METGVGGVDAQVAAVSGDTEPDQVTRRRFVPRRDTVVRAVAAVVLGVVLMFAFPPHGLWPLAAVGAGGFAVLSRGQSPGRAAWWGFLCGLAFFVPLLHWSGVYVGVAPWLLLAFSQAAFFAPLGAALAVVTRLPWWPVWAAGLWVAQEAARGRVPFGGLPWGRLAFAQPDGPFTPYASAGGAPLVTFVVALAGCLLAAAVLPAHLGGVAGGAVRRRAVAAGVAAVVVAGGAALGLTLPPTGPVKGGRTAVVAVVQGNVPRLGLDFNAQREQVLRNHVDQTVALAERVDSGAQPRPDLVIWPENASDIDPIANPDAAAAISDAARQIGAPILVGALLDGPADNERRNVGIVWDPVTGAGATYVKQHPVPFAEYIPLRSLARRVSNKVDLVPRDMVAGDQTGALRVGPVTVGDVICFEVAYDGLVRDAVTDGGGLIVVQTNNATFGRTGETYQQLAMGRLRAVEHGRTVIVAATSGISAVIGPDGSLRWRTDILTPGVYDDRVAVRDSHTLATRLGVVPEWLLSAVGLAAMGYVAATAVARRRRHAQR